MSRDYNVLARYFGVLARYFGVPAKLGPNPALQRERAKSAGAMAAAKRLATHHGVDIERDSAGGWWVTCDRFTEEDDPLYGSHFCTDGREVLEAVGTYIEAISKKGGTT